MYFVHFKAPIGYSLCQFETLGEAKECVKELTSRGIHEVYVSQQIPMKVTVSVEF
jgi:hypothetical protein